MPNVRKIITTTVQDNDGIYYEETTAIIPLEIKRKRGRPAGSKNKPRKKKPIKGAELDKTYRYYFIADACGCRYGVNVIGSGMWCEHKNSMHLEDRKKYTETEFIKDET